MGVRPQGLPVLQGLFPLTLDYRPYQSPVKNQGGRGTCTAFLAGELIADMACGTPRCVPDDLLPAMLPQRFLVRDLRSGPRA